MFIKKIPRVPLSQQRAKQLLALSRKLSTEPTHLQVLTVDRAHNSALGRRRLGADPKVAFVQVSEQELGLVDVDHRPRVTSDGNGRDLNQPTDDHLGEVGPLGAQRSQNQLWP